VRIKLILKSKVVVELEMRMWEGRSFLEKIVHQDHGLFWDGPSGRRGWVPINQRVRL
jgi:hypothetical protein